MVNKTNTNIKISLYHIIILMHVCIYIYIYRCIHYHNITIDMINNSILCLGNI